MYSSPGTRGGTSRPVASGHRPASPPAGARSLASSASRPGRRSALAHRRDDRRLGRAVALRKSRSRAKRSTSCAGQASPRRAAAEDRAGIVGKLRQHRGRQEHLMDALLGEKIQRDRSPQAGFAAMESPACRPAKVRSAARRPTSQTTETRTAADAARWAGECRGMACARAASERCSISTPFGCPSSPRCK